MSLPRSAVNCLSDSPATSRSPSSTVPVTRAVSGSSPIAARDDTDLPEPDSPTTASTSPGFTSNVTSSTARTGPASVLKVTES